MLEEDPARVAARRTAFGERLLIIKDPPATRHGQAHALQGTLAKFSTLDAYVGDSRMADDELALAALPDDDSLSAGLEAILGACVKAYVYGARTMRDTLLSSVGSMMNQI